MNDKILERDGKLAVMKRVSGDGDIRSNISAGGTAEAFSLNSRQLQVVEIVKPLLIRDGIFFAGLDFIGDKLTEVNVFSPGGVGVISQLIKVDFIDEIINELERKHYIRSHYNYKLSKMGYPIKTRDMNRIKYC